MDRLQWLRDEYDRLTKERARVPSPQYGIDLGKLEFEPYAEISQKMDSTWEEMLQLESEISGYPIRRS